MSLEMWNTIGSVGTLVVIASTEIVALVQLRHMRGSNQIAALTEIREALESPVYKAATQFITYQLPQLLEDSSVRTRLQKRPLDNELQPVEMIGNFYENMGAFIKYGIIDKHIALDLWCGVILENWKALEPATVIRRRTLSPVLLENFEYISVLAEDWMAYPTFSSYPKRTRRRTIEDQWLAIDRR